MSPATTPGLVSLPSLAVYGWMSRLGIREYRSKIMLMAFCGTHVPLISLSLYHAVRAGDGPIGVLGTLGITLVATLAGTALTLLVLDHLLRPVLATAAALRAYREGGPRVRLPTEFSDEVGTLMADADRTLAHLDRTLDVLAHVDEVTGLPNRRRFLQQVDTRRAAGEPFAVVAVRVANLPRLVQTLDTAAGDVVMRTLAARLAERTHVAHALSRTARSEFACLIALDPLATVDWSDLTERVRDALAACSGELVLGDVTVRPALVVGVAVHPDDAALSDVLLDRAASAAAQATDDEPVSFHSSVSTEAAIERLKLESELRRAIDGDELTLHYQPVVEAGSGRVVGAEALVRWLHPERGLLGPGVFVPVAEASGLITPLGLWVLDRACAQLRVWSEQGLDLRVAVNLSARQFADDALVQHVLNAAERHGVSPHQLEIELTETVAMADHEHTRRVFAALRDAGVGIAIDDFGTGYASMSWLRKLPFDKLKIDREFVRDVDADADNQAICGALIALARGLGLTVLAEGAETDREVRYLRAQGCSLFQGYHFSRPVPPEDLLRFASGSGGDDACVAA